MPTFQVTYVDSVLRQVDVQADTAEEAETLVREQMDHAEHHHAIDAWSDDWEVKPHAIPAKYNWRCFECGQLLK
jgi:vancomycin resistance protein YoaR